MKTKSILIILAAVTSVGVILYSLFGNPSPRDYAKEIQDERETKDKFMQSDKDSPLARYDKESKPLNYFPPDLKYQIRAVMTPVENKKIVRLRTSDGKAMEYLEYAHAKFTLDSLENNILILEITEPGPSHGTLFLSFADETSAKETYGAGRYLDLKKIPGASSIVLDFNKAYNPYCAYSDNYSCPLPPPENILKVAVRAGEKSYH